MDRCTVSILIPSGSSKGSGKSEVSTSQKIRPLISLDTQHVRLLNTPTKQSNAQHLVEY